MTFPLFLKAAILSIYSPEANQNWLTVSSTPIRKKFVFKRDIIDVDFEKFRCLRVVYAPWLILSEKNLTDVILSENIIFAWRDMQSDQQFIRLLPICLFYNAFHLWVQLKKSPVYFEISKREPKIFVCIRATVNHCNWYYHILPHWFPP